MSRKSKVPTSPAGYDDLLTELSGRVSAARARAALAANQEVVVLYWEIGRAILVRQAQVGWGAQVIERLAVDLRKLFPDITGFSPRNLTYMRSFAEAWPSLEDVRDVAALVPWSHNITLLQKVDDPATRQFYARACTANGWSRPVLTVQIETKLHERSGRALTNFERTMPSSTSDLARETLKDPYVFDFLSMTAAADERHVEQGLVDHVQRFLLELGVGFAFVGRQYRLEVGGDEFFLDLLFYHLKLRCFVVIELKVVAFQPEFAGKLNFYLSAVDAQLRHADDQPTIGLLLCKDKNRVVVEYALRGIDKPIGVASWEARLMESLPDRLRGALPTVEQLENELAAVTSDPD